MSLTPFFEASLAIQIHIVCALGALVLGGVVLFRRKGGPWHRVSGRVWFGLMIGVAASSIFINQLKTFGPFSALHGFTLLTFGSLVYAIFAIRRGDRQGHEYTLKALYFSGLVFAGVLTLSRDLVMHRIVFGENSELIPTMNELPGGIYGITFGGATLIALFFVTVNLVVNRRLRSARA